MDYIGSRHDQAPTHVLGPDRVSGSGTLIGGKDNPEGLERIVVTGQGHGLSLVKRIKKGLELVLIGMVSNVAGVCESDWQLGPRLVAQVELGGIQLVVQNTALTATELSVKIVGHQAVDDTGALAYRAVAELQDGGGRRGVFVAAENLV